MVRKTTKQRNEELAKEGKQLRYYGLKLRMRPSKAQREQIHQTIGNARFTHNFYLSERKEVYQLTGETLTYGEFKKAFNKLKDHPYFNWLQKSDKFALECAMEEVEDAFNRFFSGQNGFPKLKNKHSSKQSYTTKETNHNIHLNIQNKTAKLPKLGNVKVNLSKKHLKMLQEQGLKGRIKSATITYHSSGQYYVSLKIEEIIPLERPLDVFSIPDKDIIGLDMGLLFFYIDSNGNKVDNPKFLKKALKKLAKFQRQLKNKKKGSSNYKKFQKKISKLHLHIANQRLDFLHQESRKVVDENQVITLEDLNVKGMVKNRRLARSISDVSWSMFKTFVTYKAKWANKTVVLVDRFFASSKLCNGCNTKNTMLSLSDREWVCLNCGTKHDRDINASKNIKEEGIRILRSLPKSA